MAVPIALGPDHTVVREGSLDRPHQDVQSVVDEFCLHVKLSPHRSLFAASPNLATSRPGHGVYIKEQPLMYACVCVCPRLVSSFEPILSF